MFGTNTENNKWHRWQGELDTVEIGQSSFFYTVTQVCTKGNSLHLTTAGDGGEKLPEPLFLLLEEEKKNKLVFKGLQSV